MGTWQKRARIVLAIFGVAVAVVVYFSIGERRPNAPPAPVNREDQNAQVEVRQGEAQRLRATEQDFSIKFARSLAYEDGSQKMFEVKITVNKPDGRAYVVTADEATAGKDQRERQLNGHVVLKVSDGFEM